MRMYLPLARVSVCIRIIDLFMVCFQRAEEESTTMVSAADGT